MLRSYQHDIVRHIIDNERCAVFASMGSGKTLSVLTALDQLTLLEGSGPVLVIAPLRVAKSTWPDEIRKWPSTQHMRVSVVVGTPAQRRAALKANADIFCTNFENLVWLHDELAGDWPFKTVVVDESSKLKSFRLRQGSVRARALARVAHTHIDRIILLTGTPAAQGLQDLWGQLWYIDAGKRLGVSFKTFTDRWFTTKQVGASRFATEVRPLPHAQEDIQLKLKDVCLTIDVRDHMPISEPFVNVITVDLPQRARDMYTEMERAMFTSLKGVEFEAMSAAAKTMKCLQLANGCIYNDETCSTWTEVHREKLDALESIIEEAAGEPVLVSYHFRSDLARLLKAFPQGRALDKNPDTIAAWNRGEIPVLFAHPASAGHGLNLAQGGHILAFFSVDWSLENHSQIIERLGPTRQAQMGSGHICQLHYILARDTVDQMVMARLQSKKSVQDILLDALKRRTN
jgi:SNF2 family DNA or RNA helicase